jgi:hypothetical protein
MTEPQPTAGAARILLLALVALVAGVAAIALVVSLAADVLGG